jgi:hypothetical protein
VNGPKAPSSSGFTKADTNALKAIGAQFFVNGAVVASFVPRLPEVRDQVDLTLGAVGLLMSLAGVAGLLASFLVGRIIDRFGTKVVLLVSGAISTLALPLVGVADTAWLLLVAFVLMQFFDVLMDVAMNLQGSWLSKRRHTPVINRLHGLWSFGAVVGGLASAQIAAAGISLTRHLLIAAVTLLLVLAVGSRHLLVVDEHSIPEPVTTRSASTSRNGLLALFVMAGIFAIAIESVTLEWAAFRFTDDLGSTAGFAALGYLVGAVGMTIGRLGGDWAAVALGPVWLLRLALALTGIGILGATLIDNRYATLGGFFVTGLGAATLLPTLYDQAAQKKGRPGEGIGALSAGIRGAMLMVPVVVGGLAGTSLSVGHAIALVSLPGVVGSWVVIERLRTLSD